jgi:hypothetical protein
MIRFDGVSHMARVEFDVGAGTDPQVDRAKLLPRLGMDHSEMMGRGFVRRVQRKIDPFQPQVSVLKRD